MNKGDQVALIVAITVAGLIMWAFTLAIFNP